MITDAVVETAVLRGILTAEQARALAEIGRESAADGVPRTDPTDTERLRFVSGFADVFVTIGIVLFLGAAGTLLRDRLGEGPTCAVLAALSWGLAEFFTRRRRLALPSIVLLVAFTATTFLALQPVLGGPGPGRAGGLAGFGFGWVPDLLGLGRQGGAGMAGSFFLTALLVAANFWRFRVPISIAAAGGSVALAALVGIASASPGFALAWQNSLVFACGALLFGLAMAFDLSDPARATRRTDIAFWLHLLAAPLLVHSLNRGLGLVGSRTLESGPALLVLALFLGLALVAILVDRRALLVSGLVYAGYAFSSLIRDAVLGERVFATTLLALGAFVLLVSAGWAPMRRALLSRLPAPLSGRLPALPLR